MDLPVMPPVKPMLAKAVSILPRDMLYEPKWDGFRLIVFRDGDEVEFASRNELPMGRYFPELIAALDGQHGRIYVTPLTDSYRLAERWFRTFEGAGLDGVVAKPRDLPYAEDQRVMFKVKHARTADCVVAGFRWYKRGPVVGSLLLGLHDERGELQHVGVTSSFSLARRQELLDEIAPYRLHEGDHHPWMGSVSAERIPGGLSRWSGGKDLSWEPLRPGLVCEVTYDHMEGRRFRHTAQFKRWRPDRYPASCNYEQIERARFPRPPLREREPHVDRIPA